MRRLWTLAAALAALPVACSSPPAEDPPAAAPAAAAAEAAPAEEETAAAEPVIDEEADEILRNVGRTLAEAERFSFRVEATFDQFLSDGRAVELWGESHLFVKRPHCVRSESVIDRGQRVLQFDGTKFGLANLTKNVHVEATSPSPMTIEELLDTLHEEFGVTVPLADLLTDDPYQAFADGMDRATYLGRHILRGVRCDHLSGSSGGIDWQMWVPAEGPAVPARLVFQSSGDGGAERFSAFLSDWNLADASPDSAFAFAAPEGSRRIKMARRADATETAAAESPPEPAPAEGGGR